MSNPGTSTPSGPDPATPRWDTIRQLFENALEAAPADAERLVRQQAGGDESLVREVLELLECHTDADGFGTSPLAETVATDPAPAGRRLGPFRILRELAAGGMGVVFEAEQESPRRRVALKVLRTSLLGSESLRRFREESEILARLRHPGIAQVYAAGSDRLDGTGEELPFIALELVEDARPLIAFAKDRGLPWRARIELLLQVCDAVQHGHQRGVIHRDLKPHNLLVDGEGRCKVVDFGIARLVERDAADARTVAGTVLGTPAYMSPEQLEGDPDAVDVRSDVYALGVILFELVTGTQPFDLAGMPLTEVLRVLRHAGEPPRPSSRAPTLPREVDWIFGKAIERDIGHRYATVHEFAADLRRLLGDEPVLVGPPSTTYRLRKLARRHRLALTAASLVLATIVGALVVSLTSRAQAVAQRDNALQEQRVAESVLRFVRDTLSAADPDRMGRDVRVRDLLRDAARELDATPALDPMVRASLDFTIGSTFAGLGLDDIALERLQRALTGFVEHAGLGDRRTIEAEAAVVGALRASGRTDDALELATRAVAHATALDPTDDVRVNCSVELAESEQSAGRYPVAIARLRGVLADLEREGQGSGSPAATVHATLGDLLRTTGALLDAREHTARAVEIERSNHGPGHPRTTNARHAHALILEALGERNEAERELRDIVARSQEALGADHRWTQSSAGNLGALLRRQGKRAEAGEILQQLLETRRETIGPDHELTLATQNNLALLRLDEQRLPEAETLFRDALDRGRRVFGPADVRLAFAMQNLAAVLRRAGDADAAGELLEEALALLEAVVGPDNQLTLQVSFNLGVLARSRRDLPRAEQLVTRALAGRRAALGPDHPDTLGALHELVRILQAAGRLEDAETAARELLDRRRTGDENDEEGGWIIAAQVLAQILDRRGAIEEAAALHEEAVRGAIATESERTVRAVNVRNVASDFWIRHGPKENALTALRQNLDALAADPELGASMRARIERRTRQLVDELGTGR